MTEEQKTRYPEGWDPHEWHDNHKPAKPRWRVREGMFEERDRLCLEFDVLNQSMANGDFSLSRTMLNLAEWERLKEAILSCEEFEDGTDPVQAYRNRRVNHEEFHRQMDRRLSDRG